VAPGYNSLNKMDAAIAALAKGGSGLASKNPGDVIVAGAQMAKNEKTGAEGIVVDTGGANCKVAIASKAPPKGMIGSATYSGKVLGCQRYMNIRAPDVMKYEDAKPALEKAAAKGQTDLSFRVVGSPQGPKVRLNK
jgi:hypothetical protein